MKKEKMHAYVELWQKNKKQLKKEDFCKKHKLSNHSLNYWIGKYNQEKKKESTEYSGFLPIEVQEASPIKNLAQRTPEVKAEIKFPSGLTLKIY